MSNSFNEMVPYYGMDRHTAKSFAPIDEYLGFTKRFSEKGMKRNNVRSAVLWSLAALASAGLLAVCVMQIPKGYAEEGITGVIAPIIGGAFLLIFSLVLFSQAKTSLKRTLDYIPPDIETARYVIDKDGMESVHQDYLSATEFTKKSVIGKKYIFIKNETVIRLQDIYHVCLIAPEEDGIIEYSRGRNDFLLELSVTTDVGDYVYRLPINDLKRDENTYRYKQQELEQVIRQKTEKIDSAHDRNRRENARRRMPPERRGTLRIIPRQNDD